MPMLSVVFSKNHLQGDVFMWCLIPKIIFEWKREKIFNVLIER